MRFRAESPLIPGESQPARTARLTAERRRRARPVRFVTKAGAVVVAGPPLVDPAHVRVAQLAALPW